MLHEGAAAKGRDLKIELPAVRWLEAEARGRLRRAAKVDADKILNALSRLKQVAGAVKGKLLGERLISWKPAASLTELAKFEPAHAKVFKGVITIELASPSLELTPPPAT